MTEDLMTTLISIITSLTSVIAVVVTNNKANQEINSNIEIQQAITNTKIENLTEEVRKHNTFGERISKLESTIELLKRK